MYECFHFFSYRFCIQLRNVLTDSVIVPFTTILVRYVDTTFHIDIWYSLNMCRCADVSVPACLGKCAHLFASFFREISASPISMFCHHWYQLLAVWLEMMSSVTILLTIQNVGRPFWLPLLVSLSDWSLCIQKYNSLLVACRALTPQYIVWMTQLEITDTVGLWYSENV